MSSKNFGKMLDLFKALSPMELKVFTGLVKDLEQDRQFNLDGLLTAKADDGIKCPHCQHKEPNGIVKFGVRRGVQWYKCKPCGRTFSAMTGSFLEGTKKGFQTWENFVQCMMEGHSVRKSAEICGINRNTAWVWRHKVLDALAQYQEHQRRMKGIVEADDTFFPLSFKGSTPIDREAHRRGTPAGKRGTSKEKVCVSCAVDRNGQKYSKVSALGRPTAKALKEVLSKRISKSAVVCTDSDRAYMKFGKDSPFEHVKVPNGIRLLGVYHVQNINAYHSRLKLFLARFKGVATKYLNNYLVWNNLIREGNRSRNELLKLCVKALTFNRWHDINQRPAIPV